MYVCSECCLLVQFLFLLCVIRVAEVDADLTLSSDHKANGPIDADAECITRPRAVLSRREVEDGLSGGNVAGGASMSWFSMRTNDNYSVGLRKSS